MTSIRKRSDTLFAITVVALVLFGVAMIYSSSVIVSYTKFGDPQFFFKRQLAYAVVGIMVMIAAANINYQVWRKWAAIMLGFTFLLLLSVFLFSKGEINGAHRWIYIGGISFQPSELAKLTFVIYLSAWLTVRTKEMHSFKTFGIFLGIISLIGLLILKQPDLGTFSIILVSALLVYVVAGITWQQAVVGMAVLSIAVMGFIATPYRRARITTFFNPTTDTSGISYHVKNIAIAVGSGGWFGLGFGASNQKRLFLPEPHTDSIFAVITEELGFVISSLLILAIAFMVYRGYCIALRCEDRFGKLLATGIVSWFAFQAFINLASMLHLVPLVGVPLPFISYGGTNLVISLAAVGILLNISRESNVTPPVAAPRKKNHRK